tara:strand:+ start:646 stop:1104 length:459 start_codon:yes stop_codon:yes gene_type:complete
MSRTCEQLKLENQLCFPLYAASRLTTKLYGPLLKPLDITYPQYLVLLVLWEQKEISVKEIGARLFLESNTLTPLLKRLEQKKFIVRMRSTQDERTVIVSLTSRGEKLKDEAETIPLHIHNLFSQSAFEKSELVTFQNNLKKLLDMLRQEIDS